MNVIMIHILLTLLNGILTTTMLILVRKCMVNTTKVNDIIIDDYSSVVDRLSVVENKLVFIDPTTTCSKTTEDFKKGDIDVQN